MDSWKLTTSYTYDLRDLLTSVNVQSLPALEGVQDLDAIQPVSERTNNNYDAAGKRIERVENSNSASNAKTTKFYYSGDSLLYTTDAGNVLQTENILDLAGDVIASKRFQAPDEAQQNEYANKYYFYCYDARGSVQSIFDPSAQRVKDYTYDEFGNIEKTTENGFINDITYAGSVSDLSTGLQYMNARFYNPATGRFLTQDTYSGNPYDTWTQHLYSYCGNNPVNMVDPTGHFSVYYSQIRKAAQTSYNYSIEYSVKANDALMAYNSVMATDASYFGGQSKKDKRASSLWSQYKYNLENAKSFERQGDYFMSQLGAADERARRESVKAAQEKGYGSVLVLSQNASLTLDKGVFEARFIFAVDKNGNAALQYSYGASLNMGPPSASFSSNTYLSFWDAPTPDDLLGPSLSAGVTGSVWPPLWPVSVNAGGNVMTNTLNGDKTKYHGGEIIIGGASYPPSNSIAVSGGGSRTENIVVFKLWG